MENKEHEKDKKQTKKKHLLPGSHLMADEEMKKEMGGIMEKRMKKEMGKS